MGNGEMGNGTVSQFPEDAHFSITLKKSVILFCYISRQSFLHGACMVERYQVFHCIDMILK